MSWFLYRAIRALLALPLFASLSLLLGGLLRSAADAQEIFDAALFQPVTASRSGARELVTPQGGAMSFTTGDFVEVVLPVDEYGSSCVVRSVLPELESSAEVDLEIAGRAVPGGPLTSFGVFASPANAGLPLSLAVPTRLAALRIEFRRNRNPNVPVPVLASLRVNALATTRVLEIAGHGWFRQAPPRGTWTSCALRVRNAWEDDFGLLFAAVGRPLLGSPIFLLPTARGGLLLDPAAMSLVEVRPLSGGSWYFVVSFPFDPAILSVPLHLQAVVGEGLASPQATQLFWTRPLTIHS